MVCVCVCVCEEMFSLCIDSGRRAVAQRENQAPVAAETQSSVGSAWCSQCCSSSPSVDLGPLGGGEGAASICFHFLSKWSWRDESFMSLRGLLCG